MVQMNLKEARAAKARLGKELDALVQKREQVAVVKIAPGEDAQDYINVTVDELTEKIDVCIDKLKKLGAVVYPSEANFILCKFEDVENIWEQLVKKKFLVRRCDNFIGLDTSFIRIAVKMHEENVLLIKAIKEILSE